MSGAIPQLPLYAFTAWTGETLPLDIITLLLLLLLLLLYQAVFSEILQVCRQQIQ